ncbi:MAG TPA: tetratricopeptide repeat protein [Candidatus Angelobacter sp.]|nr:tetratricopeptide repeat protein [Candidatus Angelobacter sp.]
MSKRTFLRPALAASVLLTAGASASGQAVPAWSPVSKWSTSFFNCPSQQEREDLTRRAAAGEANAQDRLGTFHLSTCQDDKNPSEGTKLLERAAAQGNAHAQLTLGEAYRDGKAGARDMQKAVAWFEKAAVADDARAQNNLGVALRLGQGVTKNEANAARLFRIASQQSLHEAEYNLATLYDQGRGVEQDYETARDWYESAAQASDGDSDAEYRLGMLYELGLGGDKDPKESVDWFKKAADHGSFYAALRLATSPPAGAPHFESERFLYLAGQALASGRGVQRDEPRAFSLVKQSAERNYEPAMFMLATMYNAGRGTPKNESKALEAYLQVIAKNDRHYVAYNNYAWILVTAEDRKLRDPQKALPYAQKAVDLSGGREAYALDTLARVYFQLGDVDKAIELQTKALAIAPDRENYQKALAEYREAKAHPPASK